jgi:hypothetical protein
LVAGGGVTVTGGATLLVPAMPPGGWVATGVDGVAGLLAAGGTTGMVGPVVGLEGEFGVELPHAASNATSVKPIASMPRPPGLRWGFGSGFGSLAASAVINLDMICCLQRPNGCAFAERAAMRYA